MNWLRSLISYGITLGIIIALVTIVPRFSRQRVHPDYSDITNLAVDHSLSTDKGFAFSRLAKGDAIVYRLGNQETQAVCIGWVAAVAGEEVAVVGGKLIAGGKAAPGEAIEQPDRAPILVPAGHVFVTSSRHQLDSLAYGPIPAAAYRGKILGDLELTSTQP
jgi:hypothetical protein